MDTKGFVYVMTNPSMPGLVKIGMSKRVPTERTTDDDMASTGIPKRFEVQYYAFFEDMFKAEREAHHNLKEYHYGKEFFKTDVATAIVAIESIDIPFTKLYSKPDDDRKAEQIRIAKEKAEREERERLKQLKIQKEKRERAENRARTEKLRLRKIDEDTIKVINSGPIALKHVVYIVLLIAMGIGISLEERNLIPIIMTGLYAAGVLIFGFVSRRKDKKHARELRKKESSPLIIDAEEIFKPFALTKSNKHK